MIGHTYTVIFADRAGFIAMLADGWRLPFIVEPMKAHHGRHAILLDRDDQNLVGDEALERLAATSTATREP